MLGWKGLGNFSGMIFAKAMATLNKNHILLFFPSISNLMMKWAFPVVIKVFCQKTENQGLNGFLSALRYIVEFYVCHSLKFIEKFVLRVTAYFVLLYTISVTYYCMLDVVMVLNWLNEWTMNRLINRQFLWFKIFLLGVIFYKLVWLHFSFFWILVGKGIKIKLMWWWWWIKKMFELHHWSVDGKFCVHYTWLS